METKLDEPSMREITSSLGFPFASLVPSIDISGGLCLCWKSGVDIEITSQNKNLINALIFSDPPFSPWMLSAIYVPPIAHLRNVFWESLNKTGQSFCGPRLCIGDFNVLLSQSDKRGGRPFASSYTNIFGSLISDHGLIDLGFSGNPFTWSNKRSSLANIKERLNRAFSNSEWRLLFPNATLLHYPATSSDHNPLILNTSGTILSLPKPFRFEAFWTRDSSSSQVIQDTWNHVSFGSPFYQFLQKIKTSKKFLIRWNKNCFGNLQTRTNSLTEAINQIQQQPPTEENTQKEKTLIWELNENLKREEILWKQKSIVQWLTAPDLNTKFFHLSTIIRRRKNSIDFLKNNQNNWISGRQEIGTCFTEFFKCLFTSTSPSFGIVFWISTH
jgi:hypothetical protein